MAAHRHPSIFGVLLSAWVVAALAGSARAQPLVELVPDDAVLYVGWRGAADLGPGFKGSHLKAVLDASQVGQLVDEFFPKVIALADQRDDAAPGAAAAAAVAQAAWRHPCAIYFAGFAQGDGPPTPRAALMIKAGADTGKVAAALRGLVAQGAAPDAPPKAVVTEADGVVTLSARGPEKVGKSLAGHPRFARALKRTTAEPVILAYADIEGMMEMANAMVEKRGDPKAAQGWAEVRDKLNLPGLKRVVVTGGFQGKMWATRAFVEAPAPRTGLAAMLEGRPISDAALRLVPRGSAWVVATRLDLGATLQACRQLLTRFNPDADQGIDAAFAEAKAKLGVDLQADLLDPLGDEWVIYTDATVTGNGMLQVALANRLRDGAKFEAGLVRLQQGIAAMAAKGEGPAGPGQPRLRFHETRTKAPDLTLHYLSIPFVAPAWAVQDNVLYAGLFPQVVMAAAQQGRGGDAGGKAGSILDNPGFADLRKQLAGEAGVTAISYVDLDRTVGDSYQMVLAITQLFLGAADIMGVDAPPLLIPPLPVLRAHMAPAGTASWTDAAGWQMAGLTPFPGAELLGSQQAMGAQAQAMLVAFMLAAGQRSQDRAAVAD